MDDLEKLIAENPPGPNDACFIIDVPPIDGDFYSFIKAKYDAGWRCSGCGSPGGYICVCG
jgi:hypothetical protein